MIQRSLASHDIRTVVMPKRLDLMDDIDIKIRKKFAQEHSKWTINDWKVIIFVDKADLLPTHSGKRYLRLKESQTIGGLNIKKGWKQKKLTIKVFGIISFWGVGP